MGKIINKKNILTIITLIVCFTIVIFLFALFSNKTEQDDTPIAIPLNDTTDETLDELVGKKVFVCGYFLSNTPQNNVAYLCEVPLQTIYNLDTENEEDIEYQHISLSENGFIAVHFDDSPEYTTRPVCVIGTLIKGNFEDSYYFSYNYMVSHAEYSIVPSYELPEKVRMYDTIAENKYPQVFYNELLQMQLYATGYTEEFPDIYGYQEFSDNLSRKVTPNKAETEFLDFYKSLYELSVEYKDLPATDENLTALATSLNEIYQKFNLYLWQYAAFSYTQAIE